MKEIDPPRPTLAGPVVRVIDPEFPLLPTPLLKTKKPETPPFEEASGVDISTFPLEVEPEPLFIIILPPLWPPFESPAESESDPPEPLFPEPTVIEIDPERPKVAGPPLKIIAPELPELADPELIVRVPLTPEDPAFAVCSRIDPLDDVEDTPLITEIKPPVFDETPEDKVMDPPVPELPLPTETKTDPPRPLVATELAIKRLPLDPDVLEPVLTNIEPDI